MELHPIAYIRNDFPTKFGLPRQSGMSEHLISQIVMEPLYRNADAFRGITEFEYLWLIWLFSPMGKREWSPTVRPPKLGGNKRMGVFATRSPNRPNPVGLTRVKLLSLDLTAEGPVLTVSGADLMSGTAILDIKPYLPFADSVPDALTGAYGPGTQEPLAVVIPPDIAALFTAPQLAALREALSCDPRPGYQSDPDRVYGFAYGGYDIRFRVADGTATVCSAEKRG
ncbi:MAG: tRNA (N6-threonylcarbamoyladenosine(37)-N6)-methyltransferase TrmO [Ruminococcus sp.]